LDNLAKLKDIKPLVDISDNSFYIFLIVVFLVVLMVVILGIWIYKKSKKENYIFDLDNPKKTAYQLIDIIRDKEGSKEYIDKLHNYTYKKEVPKLDMALFDEIVKKFKINY